MIKQPTVEDSVDLHCELWIKRMFLKQKNHTYIAGQSPNTQPKAKALLAWGFKHRVVPKVTKCVQTLSETNKMRIKHKEKRKKTTLNKLVISMWKSHSLKPQFKLLQSLQLQTTLASRFLRKTSRKDLF